MERENNAVVSWVNVIAGVWLIIAPFVLGYVNSNPRTNDIWLGIIVGILALIRVFAPLKTVWASWLNVIAGIWLIIAPFILHYSYAAPRWNDVILGIIVAAIAIWSAGMTTDVQGTRHAGA